MLVSAEVPVVGSAVLPRLLPVVVSVLSRPVPVAVSAGAPSLPAGRLEND